MYYPEFYLKYYIKNVAYNGTDFILFSNPKFLLEIRIAYSDLYCFIKEFKLFALLFSDDFTSIGTILSSLIIIKSTSEPFVDTSHLNKATFYYNFLNYFLLS